jgi:hypothetical protein
LDGGRGVSSGSSGIGASVSSTNTGVAACLAGNNGDIADPRRNAAAWATIDRNIIFLTSHPWSGSTPSNVENRFIVPHNSMK